MWHADGYDKLSPFGLTIHGCADGYIYSHSMCCSSVDYASMHALYIVFQGR